MRALLCTALLLLGGCKQILGIDQFDLPDGGGTPDGEPDASKEDAPNGPRLQGQIISITGTNQTSTNDVGENVIWADLANGDPLDSTVTDSQGQFEVSLAGGDMGQLKIGPDLVYAVPGHVTFDTFITAAVFDEAAFTALLDSFQETVVPDDAFFYVIVQDGDRQPVEGAMVTMTPLNATTAYADESGNPEMGRTTTSTSGGVWFFNAPANTLYNFSATKDTTTYGTYAIMPAQNALVYAPLLPTN